MLGLKLNPPGWDFTHHKMLLRELHKYLTQISFYKTMTVFKVVLFLFSIVKHPEDCSRIDFGPPEELALVRFGRKLLLPGLGRH